jgi:hypothetical protein
MSIVFGSAMPSWALRLLLFAPFTPPLAAECVTAAVRPGEPAAGVAVETFARLESPELLTHLSALEKAEAPPGKVLEALQAITDGNPDVRDRLLRDFASDPLCVEFLLADFRKRWAWN